MNEVSLKYKFGVVNLFCADCALKIENAINKLDLIKQCKINLVSETISVELKTESDPNSLKKTINRIFDDIEPGSGLSEIHLSKKDKHENGVNNNKFKLLIIALIIFVALMTLRIPNPLGGVLYLALYVFAGYSILMSSARKIFTGRFLDENFLMTIATLGAIFIGEFPEAVAVMILCNIGMSFEEKAVNRSRGSIKSLLELRPEYANLFVNNECVEVEPETVNVGDIILIKPGERFPLDGKILEGSSCVDTKAITGESVPRNVKIGDVVYSGFVNGGNLLKVVVEKKYSDSTVAKILELVETASEKKSKTESLITKFAAVYTPIVVAAAAIIAVAVPLLFGLPFTPWISRAMIFLVVSCPCALVISVPLSFFAGIGKASKNGILIKGSNYLEALNDVKTVVFDKTGTLTHGKFVVSSIKPEEGYNESEVLYYAAICEQYSTHPIAVSINEYFNSTIKEKVLEFKEFSGKGILVQLLDKEVICGNKKLFEELKAAGINKQDDGGTTVFVAINRKLIGSINVADEVKADSKSAIAELKKAGIKKTIMLSGDNNETVNKVGEFLGMDESYGELLPADKVRVVEKLRGNSSKKVMFVGDGINDAPVIALADIGVAMGSLGSDAAIESADIVLMNDEPSKIVTAIKIAGRTRKIVFQNITFAICIKVAILVLASAGFATMWEAVFADVGVAVIAILNAVRV